MEHKYKPGTRIICLEISEFECYIVGVFLNHYLIVFDDQSKGLHPISYIDEVFTKV